MPWYLFAISGVVVNALSHVIRRKVMTKQHKLDFYTSAYLFSFANSIVLFVYILFTGFTMPPIGSIFLVFVINMIFGLVGWLVNNKALSLLPLGEYSVLMTSRQLITWVTSILFLGIGLSAVQGVGSAIIIAGILIVYMHKSAWKGNNAKGVGYTLLTALIYGTAILTDQIIYRSSDPASYLLLGFMVNTMLLAALRPRVVVKTKLLISRQWSPMLLGFGVLSSASLVLMFTSLKIADNAPLVSAVFQLQTIASVVFGIVLLKETKHLAYKLTGASVATIGAILVIIG